ncbi:hypothetical protein [Anabaena azotica]|uniref:Uncharacterized protein n=1 Tax=Anabaena azotica FACHB-119 TaxID=947527 RepID=A0ABR8DDE7_9NOST|nr:hypothetical protein [Anabaena azotica]MBD2505134.1 hypothetical protein [Anabaena azotica FACHB-119]
MTMNSNNTVIFWTDAKNQRYFLIPEKQKLARGSFLIHTLTGKQKKVTQMAIAGFEISQTEAKKYLQTEINQGMQQAKATFSHLASSTPASDEDLLTPNIIFSLLGITPQELENNPEAAQTAFVKLYSDIKALLGESNPENSAQTEAMRQRIRSLRESIQAQAINVNIEELPENLQPRVEGYLQEIITQLENLTNQIDHPHTDGQNIDEVIETLTKDFLVKENKRQEDNRKQQYKQSATDAIAQSFQSLGLRSFAGGDFE